MATSASVNLYDSCIVESGRQMRSNRKRDLGERSNRDRVRREKKKREGDQWEAWRKTFCYNTGEDVGGKLKGSDRQKCSAKTNGGI